jgi:bifunctional DNA-binding transcriptional regulator/antitoxin component of YhaV-PrlF toxin-antitoxin module
MLAKITRGNQITIPKEVVKQAHLNESSPYVEVVYMHGVICLKPVTVEECVPPEQFEKFQKWALDKEEGDSSFGSIDEGIQHLKKRVKKN